MEFALTNDILVAVETQFLPERSNPRAGVFTFGYHILIENNSQHTVQLLRRHWFITDGHGQLREVEGSGVVGEHPILLPGEKYDYDSFCELYTEIGKMRGHYLMTRTDDGTLFEVEIPEFRMVSPEVLN